MKDDRAKGNIADVLSRKIEIRLSFFRSGGGGSTDITSLYFPDTRRRGLYSRST